MFSRKNNRRSAIALRPEDDAEGWNVPTDIPDYQTFLVETEAPNGKRTLRRANWMLWPGTLPDDGGPPWGNERRLLIGVQEVMVLYLS